MGRLDSIRRVKFQELYHHKYFREKTLHRKYIQGPNFISVVTHDNLRRMVYEVGILLGYEKSNSKILVQRNYRKKKKIFFQFYTYSSITFFFMTF